MNLQPGPKVPFSTSLKQPNKKWSSSLITTVMILLLIAIAVMGIMTVKKFFEAQQTTLTAVDIKDLTKIVNDNPDSIEARLRLAFAFQKEERYDEAREQYLEVLKVEPLNQGALFNLGEIDRVNKNYVGAETRFKLLLKNYEYHVLGSWSLGQVYLETKKYDEAIKLMDKMLVGSPNTVDFIIIKAEALAKKGNKAQAKAVYKSALKFDPENKTVKQALEGLK